MLTHEALPTPPPDPHPTDPPEANGGGGTRNAFVLYDVPVKRVLHHLVDVVAVQDHATGAAGSVKVPLAGK